MKIYTSYFAKETKLRELGIIPIGIALYAPKFFKGASIPELAPKRFMLSDSMSHEEYTKNYYAHILNNFSASALIEHLGKRSAGLDVALLCYEKPGDFCHRHIVAEWLKEKEGIDVVEYDFASNEPIKEVESVQQLDLF